MVCAVYVGVCVGTVFTYGVWGVRRCLCMHSVYVWCLGWTYVFVWAQFLRMVFVVYVGVCVCTVFTYDVWGGRRCLCVHSVYVWCVGCT